MTIRMTFVVQLNPLVAKLAGECRRRVGKTPFVGEDTLSFDALSVVKPHDGQHVFRVESVASRPLY
jgi:hypothetical protein